MHPGTQQQTCRLQACRNIDGCRAGCSDGTAFLHTPAPTVRCLTAASPEIWCDSRQATGGCMGAKASCRLAQGPARGSHLSRCRSDSISGSIWCSFRGTVRERLTWYSPCGGAAALGASPDACAADGRAAPWQPLLAGACTIACRAGMRADTADSSWPSGDRQAGAVGTAQHGKGSGARE